MLIGEDVVHGRRFASVDPASPTRIVAHAHAATAATPTTPITRAEHGHPAWSRTPAAERAAALTRAAGILRAPPARARRARRARGRQALGRGRRRRLRGDRLPRLLRAGRARARRRPAAAPDARRAQRDALRRPRRHRRDRAVELPARDRRRDGLGAALATGNAVVLKPAEQAPACAKAIVDALHAGGVPLDALSLLPGGDEPGKALVDDPRIHTIVFTGSCAVGLQILEAAAKVVPGQRHLKRVIAEMGGKNCVIVDSDADLDDVVPALLKSAFAFAGQKCSAASRALVHQAIADELAERLAGAITTLKRRPGAGLRHRRPAGDRHRRPAADRALHRHRDAARPGRDPRRRLLRPADDLRRPAGGLARDPARRSSARC